MNAKYFISFICVAFSFLTGQAQQTESDSLNIDSTYSYSFFESVFPIIQTFQNDTLDFHFNGFDYDKNGYLYLNTGNSGQSRYSVLFDPINLRPTLFKGFDSYFSTRSNTAYIQTSSPYSELTYTTGAKKDQVFNLMHTRNFGKGFNIKLDLTKSSADGFYNNLRTENTFLNFSSNYYSRNKRYFFLTHYYVNRINARENGGFEDFDNVSNPEFSETTYLDNAKNTIKDQQYFLKQAYKFGKTSRFFNKDSTEIKKFTPRFELSYSFAYDRSFRRYEDEVLNALYYPTILQDSSTTYDSTFQKKYANEFVLSFLDVEKISIGFLGGYDFYNLYQSEIVDTTYDNYSVGGLLYKRIGNQRLSIDARYVIQGFNEEDVYINSNFGSRSNLDSCKITYNLQFNYDHRAVDYFLLRHSSNHFEWNNNFEKVTTQSIKLNVSLKKSRLEINAANFNDLILFNNRAKPFQYESTLSAISVTVGRELELGNFVLDNQISYQTNNNKNALPLPEIVLKETLYYENFLLKKALQTRIGVTAFYYSEHDGYDYMPALNQFHLRDDKEERLGDYPYFEVFLDLKIKRMLISFKATHANEGIFSNTYFMVPNYPALPRVIRFGVKWKLYN